MSYMNIGVTIVRRQPGFVRGWNPGVTIENRDYREISFNERDLSGITFKNCRFSWCLFERAILNGTKFVDCLFDHGYMNHSQGPVTFVNSKFDWTNLHFVQWTGSTFENVQFVGGGGFNEAVLEESTFNGCKFLQHCTYTTSLVGARFTNCEINRSRLENVSMRQVRMVATSILYSTLESVDISHGVLEEVNLNNATTVSSLTHTRTRYTRCNILEFLVEKQCKKCEGKFSRNAFSQNVNICNNCCQRLSYSAKNSTIKGKQGRLPSFSFEFEVEGVRYHHFNDGDPNPLDLIAHDFIRTGDSTVDDEYKSPIYYTSAEFSKVLPVLHSLRDFVGENCGTHVHVGFSRKRDLYRNFDNLLGPLTQHMREHKEETTQFWGRYFNGFADSYDRDRYCWLNTGSSSGPTIEFRLSKFRSADQFKRLVAFERRLALFLENKMAKLDDLSPRKLREIGNEIVEMYKSAVAATEVVPA